LEIDMSQRFFEALEERRFLSAAVMDAMPVTSSAASESRAVTRAGAGANGGVNAAQFAAVGTYNGVLQLRQRDAAGRRSYIVTLAVTSQDANGALSGTLSAPEFGNTTFTGQLGPAGRRGRAVTLNFSGDRAGTVAARFAARTPDRLDGTVKDAAGKRLGTLRLNRSIGVAATPATDVTTPPASNASGGSTSTPATSVSASVPSQAATNGGPSVAGGSMGGVLNDPSSPTAILIGSRTSAVSTTTAAASTPTSVTSSTTTTTGGTTTISPSTLLGPGTAGSGPAPLGGFGIGEIPPGPQIDPANPPTLNGAPIPTGFDVGTGGGAGTGIDLTTGTVSGVTVVTNSTTTGSTNTNTTNGSSVVDTTATGTGATTTTTTSTSLGTSIFNAAVTSDLLFDDNGSLSGLGLLAFTGNEPALGDLPTSSGGMTSMTG
jgi:hypothetical protein